MLPQDVFWVGGSLISPLHLPLTEKLTPLLSLSLSSPCLSLHQVQAEPGHVAWPPCQMCCPSFPSTVWCTMQGVRRPSCGLHRGGTRKVKAARSAFAAGCNRNPAPRPRWTRARSTPGIWHQWLRTRSAFFLVQLRLCWFNMFYLSSFCLTIWGGHLCISLLKYLTLQLQDCDLQCRKRGLCASKDRLLNAEDLGQLFFMGPGRISLQINEV